MQGEKPMRKKCVSCGMICFISDVSCKRCGSTELNDFPNDEEPASNKQQNPMRSLTIWSYLILFCLAVFFEIVATSPIWGLIGSGSGGDQTGFLRLAFILNLPTVIIIWSLDKLIGTDSVLYLITPFTQIIFWFCLFVCLARRRWSKLN
jgi:hypothetical protein